MNIHTFSTMTQVPGNRNRGFWAANELNVARWRKLAVSIFIVLLYASAWCQVRVVQCPRIPQVSNAVMAWADCDGDRDLDLFMCGLDSLGTRRSYLLLQTGSSMVPDLRASLPCLLGGDAHWKDADADGDLDLALRGFDTAGQWTSVLLRNEGSGHFASTHDSLDPADFGLPKSAQSPDSGRKLPCPTGLEPEGGQFEEDTTPRDANDFDLGNFVPEDAISVDFDRNGHADLIVTGRKNGQSECRIYWWQQGSLTWFQGPESLPRLSAAKLACADYNGDGYPDFVIAGADSAGRPRSYIATYDPSLDLFEF